MKASDIARVEAYLRSVLDSSQVHIDAPRRRGGSVEVWAGDKFLETLHRDEEDGEVLFSLHITILASDLPSPAGLKKAG
jgi:tRNA G37 N-methylase Trm5